MNVAVVMGGYSGESVISLRSGQLILTNLDASKYNAFEVHILLNEWYCLVNGIKYPINKADFSFTKDNQIIT
ncbi:MAG: D-alanine--D-alanine ligase, partial [Flavobacterium sp.]